LKVSYIIEKGPPLIERQTHSQTASRRLHARCFFRVCLRKRAPPPPVVFPSFAVRWRLPRAGRRKHQRLPCSAPPAVSTPLSPPPSDSLSSCRFMKNFLQPCSSSILVFRHSYCGCLHVSFGSISDLWMRAHARVCFGFVSRSGSNQ
jgi:hypothetical protein